MNYHSKFCLRGFIFIFSSPDNCTAKVQHFKISARVADFLFLNKRLFSPIFEVLKRAILTELADF